ncbi:unnamed protein product [Auanema sp. JU1783]|nr:unnamed protein product [Auanema sp. JU1783]
MGRKNISSVRRVSNRGDKPVNSEHAPIIRSVEKKPSSPVREAFKKLYSNCDNDESVWVPGPNAVIKFMASLRLCSAMWGIIGDCDEVYNYWEPLHLLTYGEGFQTWEYSPLYAIRSYLYIYLHYIPANIFAQIFPTSKIAVFVCMRCVLGIACLSAEYILFRALCERLGNSIGRFYVLLSILSAGMFISSTAFLPSTFAMVMNMLAIAYFLREQWLAAIYFTACAALVGWPFAAMLGLPIVVHMVFIKPKDLAVQFVYYALLSGLVILSLLFTTDTYYYGKHVLAPLNIVLYNVFSGHGPDLYGVEPLSFYIKNLLLNWNIAIVFALLSVPLCAIALLKSKKKSVNEKCVLGLNSTFWRSISPVLLLFLGLFAWCLVFFTQPHKEERFMFPIYPLIAIFAAIGLDATQRILSPYSNTLKQCVWLVVVLFTCLSISRAYALQNNYGAHIEVYKSLNEHLSVVEPKRDFGGRADPIRVCVGKEWHRFPSSFFLPEKIQDRTNNTRKVKLFFLKSEFRGLLPKYYPKGKLPLITKAIPTEMNDLNKEETSRYVPFDSCEYLVDLEVPEEFNTKLEPNYGLRTDVLDKIACHPFMIQSKSHWMYRALYVPFLSSKYLTFGSYCLYQRL